MPYHRRYRKRRRGRYRRRFRRSFKKAFMRRRRTRTTQFRTKGLFLSDTAFVKFRWRAVVTFADPASAVVVLSGNSINDPGLSVSATRPTGYNQWSAFYNQYIVYASKITCQFLSAADNLTSVFALVIPYTTDQSLQGDPTEQPYAKYRIVPIGGVNGGPVTIKHYMTTKKIFGIKGQLDNSTFLANFSANPGGAWYWVLNVQELTTTADNVDTDCNVTITYYTRLQTRINLAVS